MTIIKNLFIFFVFPGFLFTAFAGLMAGWLDRKVTARLQWRLGPPWYQNFMDVAKLFYKETLMPQGASGFVFMLMPVFALVSATLVSAVIGMANMAPDSGFLGDFIVAVYFSIMPSVALMIGAAASANPLAGLGAAREMKLMLSYELPFVLTLAVPVIKSGYTVKLGEMLIYQAHNGAFIASPSGFLAFAVGIMVIQAKLGLAPFDIAEAETEITGGPYIEYSGKALAMWKLTKAALLVGLPMLLITTLFGGMGSGAGGAVKGVFKYILVLVLMTLIKNTNPRVRIDQALRFFWGPVTGAAFLSVILALAGM